MFISRHILSNTLITLNFLIVIPTSHQAIQLIELQDITGGASRIFIERPDNPATAKLNSSLEKDRVRSSKAVQYETNEDVEDALALGNSARDDNPPRYGDAEKAYRLAARLDPKDPRPYTGLGNLMYDQHRYSEAVEMYRRALSLVAARRSRQGSGERQVLIGTQPVTRDMGTWYALVGTSLLKQNSLLQAEEEFLNAVKFVPENPRWHALLGYTYLLERKFESARKSIETANRLAPHDDSYKELLRLVSREAPQSK
jgi:Flp pilus assembly protein TadD